MMMILTVRQRTMWHGTGEQLMETRMGSTLRKIQPTLIHVPTTRDIVYTPRWLSRVIIEHFQPTGLCLDPCAGDGAFFDFLPEESRDWCEIENGRDFLQFTGYVDWCIGNPPYSRLLEWIRHSFKIAENVVYLIPLHRVMGSGAFLEDVAKWGGLREILHIGTGTTAGFPFGHALAAVHYQRYWTDGTQWSSALKKPILKNTF